MSNDKLPQDRREWIPLSDYRVFAGPDWPDYASLVDGDLGSNATIEMEVQEFIRMMAENYLATIQHGDVIAQANQERQRQIFFRKEYFGSHCRVPWETMGVNRNGDVFICQSPSWIPKFVGNILETQDVFAILNSEMAMNIRREILDGRYTYCNHSLCNFFARIAQEKYLTTGDEYQPQTAKPSPELLVDKIPRDLIFDFDYTCNFRCPSCRTELINHNQHHVIRPINDRIVQKIKTQILDRVQDQPIQIRWCGGEPFISDVYLELLDYISKQGKPNIRHVIQTNGSYLKKKHDIVCQLLPTIDQMRVSFDAATESTYHSIRVNGQWHQLIENVRWLRDRIDDLGSSCQLVADFVVQKGNYREIPAFVDLCRDLGIVRINWQKMWNWATWDQKQFDENNIYRPDHPLYDDLCSMFKQANQPMSLI